jgi:sensor histidine kinase YesM
VAIVLVFSLIIINPLSELNYILALEFSWNTFTDLLWFGLLGWVITESSILVSSYLDRLLPWEQFSGKRFFLQLLAQCICVVVLMSFLLWLTDFLLTPNEGNTEEDWMGFRQVLFISIILSFIVTAIHTGNHLIVNWKNSITEANELKQSSLQSQLQSLKLQLDPHFMFNNFSTLSSLISESPVEAQLFLERLSEVHRYMLYNLDRNIIPLKEELDFISAYIYLIKIRFSENLQIEVAGVEDFLHKGIPPITLQLLIENAVKHNIASRSQPLHIRIFPENDQLLVVNNIQRMPSSLPSSRIGLKNIINRYKLLSGQLPEITETDFDFVVKVPLLPLNQNS